MYSQMLILFLPSSLTLLRIILTPLFIFLVLQGGRGAFCSVIVFTIAALTDYFDGYYARKYNVITAVGAFLDPLADKILIMSALSVFWMLNLLSWWVIALIGFRDVGITLLRLYVRRQGGVLVTSWHGKYKTVLQIILIYVFLGLAVHIVPVGMLFYCQWFAYGVMTVTLWSGGMYVYHNRALINRYCGALLVTR